MIIWRRLTQVPLMLLLAIAMMTSSALAADINLAWTADEINVVMADGASVPMWGLNGTVPGPTIRAVAGDNLNITLTNNLPEVTSLVINGQTATEVNAMTPTWTDDSTGARGGSLTKRVRSFTHETPTGAGEASYSWSNLKSGTYLITSGTHPAVQRPMGLYATLVVDSVANAQAYPDVSSAYSVDAVLLFSEVDPALNAAVDAGDYGTPAYPTSIAVGYEPKYFLINGTSYTESSLPISVAPVGETTLLRFLNAGSRSRTPVLQGDYITIIANDGNLLPYAHKLYSPDLAPGQTLDAIFQPTSEGTYAIYDRSMGLTNGGTQPGGALQQIAVGPGIQPLLSKVGVFLAGSWSLDIDGNGIWTAGADLQFNYGAATDIPIFGDWDGDGVATPGIKRGDRFYLRNSNTTGVADITFQFGAATDTPVVGDWDGNGTDTIGIKRGDRFYLRNSNTTGVADITFQYGAPTDTPIIGDWDGNGTDTIGIKRGDRYYLRNSNSSGAADVTFNYGSSTDIPVIGDWDGDGSDSLGIYRASSGVFYLRNALTTGIADETFNFGITGGQPFSGNW